MKNNILKYIILFLLTVFINDIIIGQNLYVWSETGLNLRESPNTKSKINEKLIFGDSLVVIETDVKNETLKVTEEVRGKDGLMLKGRWIKVLSRNQVGYVYSAWVSKYPIPSSYDIRRYLLKLSDNISDTIKETRLLKINYGNENSISNYNGEGCAFQTTIEIMNTTFEEGFLMCYYFFNIDNSNKKNIEKRWASEDEFYELIKTNKAGFSFHCWVEQINFKFDKGKSIITIHNG